MAASSISSSEKTFPKRGFPRAMALGIALVLTLEIVLHLVPSGWLQGYGTGLGGYFDVYHTLQDNGSADIVALGTSRGRESLVQPLLRQLLHEATGQNFTTANYSCAGSNALEMNRVAEIMFSSKKKPRAVLYFLSPAQFRDKPYNGGGLGIMGVFPGRLAGRTGQVVSAQTEEPLWKLQQWFGDHYYTFRYRYRARHLITSLVRRRQPVSTVKGDFSTWQLYAQNRSLESHPVSEARIKAYVANMLDINGEYHLGEDQLQALAQTVELCRRNNVPLFALPAPLSEDLASHFPSGLNDEFEEAVREVIELNGRKMWSIAKLELDLTRADFREQSHLNRKGGEKVTRAVADQLLIPLFLEISTR